MFILNELGESHQYLGQRFDSAQLHSPLGLQWFRRGSRSLTEACSVRAKPQLLTKSLVSLVKQPLLLLEHLKEMGLDQPYYPIDPRGLRGPHSLSSRTSLIISKNRKKEYKCTIKLFTK